MAIDATLDPVARPIESLDALYRSWGILDLVDETVETMPDGWLEILNLARHLLDGLPVPGVEIPTEVHALVTQKARYTTRVHAERKRRVVFPNTGDTEVQPLRNLLDLPQVTLPDLMLRTLSPDLFEFRLMSGSINGVYNIDSSPRIEEWDELVEEEVPIGNPNRKRQKVYALLDVSNSMRDANKMIFAKALMLAYLVRACEERANLHFRTFGNTVHARTDVVRREDFAVLARRILTVTPDGATDLKRTLNVAIGDIRGLDEERASRRLEQPPTEILLISDCESYSVPYIPQGIKLHTVHLKGGQMMSAYAEGFERVRAESTTFHEIDTTLLAMPDAVRERWLLLQDGRPLEGLPEPAAQNIEAPPGESSRERRKALLAVYDRLSDAPKTRSGSRARLVKSWHGKRSFDPLALLQLIAELCRRVFGRSREAAPAAAAADDSAPLGLHFRVRR